MQLRPIITNQLITEATHQEKGSSSIPNNSHRDYVYHLFAHIAMELN